MAFLVYDLEKEEVEGRYNDQQDATIVRDALNEVESVHRRVFPNVFRRIVNFQRYIIVRDSPSENSINNFIQNIPSFTFTTIGNNAPLGGSGAGSYSR
jgi:hypothetical protein